MSTRMFEPIDMDAARFFMLLPNLRFNVKHELTFISKNT